jgi:hypothetical protein
MLAKRLVVTQECEDRHLVGERCGLAESSDISTARHRTTTERNSTMYDNAIQEMRLRIGALENKKADAQEDIDGLVTRLSLAKKRYAEYDSLLREYGEALQVLLDNRST